MNHTMQLRHLRIPAAPAILRGRTTVKPCACLVVWLLLAFLSAGGCGSSTPTQPSDSTPPTFDRFIASGAYQSDYWPTAEWRTCSPEAAGMDSTALYRAYEFAARSDVATEGVVVIRRGYIVAEVYFRGYDQTTRFSSFSVAKSFMSAVVGVAIARGDLPGVDQLVHRYFDAWNTAGTDARKRAITIRHLLTMQSGLEFTDATSGSITGTDIERIVAAPDAVAYALNQPSVATPGTRWNYSSGDSILLSGVVQAATGRTAFSLGQEAIFNRIGMTSMSWSSDAAGHTIGGWGVGATVRDYARFGYLYLKNGSWSGERLISDAWIRQSMTPAMPLVNYYGYQWWLAPSIGAVVPADTFHAQGLYHQKIFVIPSRDLVVVRVGNDLNGSAWNDGEFLSRIMASLRN